MKERETRIVPVCGCATGLPLFFSYPLKNPLDPIRFGFIRLVNNTNTVQSRCLGVDFCKNLQSYNFLFMCYSDALGYDERGFAGLDSLPVWTSICHARSKLTLRNFACCFSNEKKKRKKEEKFVGSLFLLRHHQKAFFFFLCVFLFCVELFFSFVLVKRLLGAGNGSCNVAACYLSLFLGRRRPRRPSGWDLGVDTFTRSSREEEGKRREKVVVVTFPTSGSTTVLFFFSCFFI